MKKSISYLLVLVVLLLVVTMHAAASSNAYKLDELGLEVSIPATYDVITQNTPTSSSVFEDLGISGEELSTILRRIAFILTQFLQTKRMKK